MKITSKTFSIISFICIGFLYLSCNSSTAKQIPQKTSTITFQCMPCGLDCDKEVYTAPGECPHCNMPLVDKSTVVFKTIGVTEICNYIAKHPEVILLDVRTKEEFDGKADPDYGTLKNAINIPVQELETKISTINAYKEKEIIVYCSHSHRSPRASYMLTQNGFKNVTNLAGGMSLLTDNSCKK